MKKTEGEQAMAALWTRLFVQSSKYVDVVGTLCTNVEVLLSVSVTSLDSWVSLVQCDTTGLGPGLG